MTSETAQTPMRMTADELPPEGEWVVVLDYCFSPYFKIACREGNFWHDQGQRPDFLRQLTAYQQWSPFAQGSQLTEEEHFARAYPDPRPTGGADPDAEAGR